MGRVELDGRTGGVAMVVGYLVLLALLFRDPVRGVAAATATPWSTLVFAVLPVGGIAGGVYAALGRPFGRVALFVAGNYLALFGLVLFFRLVPTGAIPGPLLGAVLFALAVLAVVVSLRGLVAYLGGGSIDA